ncbi:MAG: hypothetical protein ABIT37_06550 [Luteolibacter sp.]
MPDSQERLIDAAVRSFAYNAEMKLAARHLLRELVKSDPEVTEKTIARWNAVDGKKRIPLGRMVVWTLLIAVFTALWLTQGGEIIDLVSRISAPRKYRERIAGNLNEHQKLLLFGSPQARCVYDPEDPAYFAEYAADVLRDGGGGSPDDQLETGRRIDPENAWFTYLAADPGPLIRPSSNGMDEEKEKSKVMQLFSEAREQTKCTSYVLDRLKHVLPLVTQKNLPEYLDSRAIVWQFSHSDDMTYYGLSNVIDTVAWDLSHAHDPSGFHELSIDAELFLRRTIGEEVAEKGSSWRNHDLHYVKEIAKSLASAAEELKLNEDAKLWNSITNRLNFWKETVDKKGDRIVVDGDTVSASEATGIFLGRVIRDSSKRVVGQPLLTDQDLKPGRLVDHEYFSWLCAGMGSLLMGFGLGSVSLYRFRVSALSRRLAGRMVALLGTRDWMWIFGLGVLLPFGWVMVINRLTPLGGREMGFGGVSGLLPTGHFLGLLVLWLVIPQLVARWQLAKQAGFVGFAKPSWGSWLATAGAVAFVPLVGWAGISHPFGEWQFGMPWFGWKDVSPRTWMAVPSLGVCAIWLISVVSQALFGRSERHFHQATMSLVLKPVFAAAMLVLALAAPAFKASERYWFAQDKLSKIDPSLPAWSVYEYKIAEQQKKELREILGDEH